MASISSRSLGVGSEVSEMADVPNDDTPQASGTLLSLLPLYVGYSSYTRHKMF